MTIGAGRFAPSPTSQLHLGNLRTALLAWLFARSTDRAILLRVEDLDTARVLAAPEVAAQQLADLAALGLSFDGDVLWQSRRLDLYRAAVAGLETYPCYCTRREIAEAASAPNGAGPAALQPAVGGQVLQSERPYPGTCLRLSHAERTRLAAIRPAALRVRAGAARQTVHDLLFGDITGEVDDFVLIRNDGTPAYNLAAVVDDLDSGVDQVVRGDDLLSSAPRQAWLAKQLGGPPPEYAHVPLALNPDGQRLAKRDGPVSLSDLRARGLEPSRVLSLLASSLGLTREGETTTPHALLDRFEAAALPRQPWILDAQAL